MLHLEAPFGGWGVRKRIYAKTVSNLFNKNVIIYYSLLSCLHGFELILEIVTGSDRK
jgi:hypothetical protein